MFDPHQIGWTEFWLRAAVAILVLMALLLLLMIAARVLFTLFDMARWVLRKTTRGRRVGSG